jgi:membrane protein DedA with SNARE-associated domain
VTVLAQPGELPGFLASVAPVLDRYGYLAVAGIVGVESFGVPAPGQTIMIAAAVYAGAGRLNIVGVIAVAFLAAVLGDNIGYVIGRGGGRRVVHRYGRYILLTPKRLDRAEGYFVRRGAKIIVAARFIDGLRQLNGVIAGVTGMPWRRFLSFNAIGAAIWVGFWCTLAYLLGVHIIDATAVIHRYLWPALAVGAVAIGGYSWVHLHRRAGRRRDAAADPEPGGEVS